MSKAGPLDAVAHINVTLYGDGSMATQGNIADIKLAMAMLDHAKDAIRGQFYPKETKLIVPSYDVTIEPTPGTHPLQEYGTVSDPAVRAAAVRKVERAGV
jgi:hypothetical protein